MDNEEIVNKIHNFYRKSKAVKDSQHPSKDFQKYYKYYQGEQLPQIKNSSIPNAVTNRIFSIIETQLPIMTDARPKIQVFPEAETGLSDEQIKERKEISSILEKIIDNIWTNTDCDIKVPAALKDCLICGTGFLFCTWNPELNDGLGDIDIRPISPINVYPDSCAVDIDSMDYLIITENTSILRLKMQYPSKAEHIQAEVNNDKSTVKVISCWLRDDSVIDYEDNGTKTKKLKYPNGRYIKIVGNTILEDRSIDQGEQIFPIIRIVDYAVSDNFWAIGECQNLVDKQDTVNMAVNKISRIINLCTSPVTILDASTGIEPDEWLNRTGAVYIKNPNSPNPVWLVPPGIQALSPIIEFMNQNVVDMQDISGIHETSQGRRVTGVTSGEMVEALNEGVYTRMRLKERNFERALEQLGNKILTLIQKYYTDERVFQIINDSGENDYITINKRELNPILDSMGNEVIGDDGLPQKVEKILNDVTLGRYRVKITAGNSLPKNKTYRLAKAEQYYSQGIFGDPNSVEAKEELLRYADWPNSNNIIKRQQRQQQEQLNQQDLLNQDNLATS